MKKTIDNVVMFPRSAIKYPTKTALHSETVPKNLAEIKDIVELLKLQKITDIMEIMLPLLTRAFAAYGIHIMNNEESLKSSVLMIEAIKAFLYRHYGLSHSLHSLSDTLVGLENGGILKNLTVTEVDGANTC